MTPLAATHAPSSPTHAVHGHTLQHLQALLDQALDQLSQQGFVAAFRLLGAPLSALWTELQATGQAPQARALCGRHALMPLVRADPYTLRAATKPRGYAGDAVMMDYIYTGLPPAGASELGGSVFAATTRSPMGLSVLFRRALLRSHIDDCVASIAGARILSVASGHCRELEGSLVEQSHFQGEFVALDQDPLSCAEVSSHHAAHRVTVRNQSVRDLIGSNGADDPEPFDLVYSAGLYDYLPDAVAQRLTARLMQLLRPGGRLLIANFLPGGSGRGYMELFMDWTLVVRDAAALRRLGELAGAHEVATFNDPHRNVVYAELSLRQLPGSSTSIRSTRHTCG